MKTRIKATKIKLTPDIKDYIDEKMNMLDKYLGNFKVMHCDLEIGMAIGSQNSGEIYRAELNLDMPGELLRVEKTEKDIKKAVEKVKDHMVRSIIKYKEKRTRSKQS